MRAFYLLIFLFLISCSRKKTKPDFIGLYTTYNAQALDSSIQSITGWTLELEEKDNFEIKGPEKKVVGYWDIKDLDYGRYEIFLQGGGVTANGIIKDNMISFNRPYSIFDSVFRNVTFKKK